MSDIHVFCLLRRRTDDTPEVILKRLNTYHTQTMPVFEYFERDNRLVRIDALRDVEQVAADMNAVLTAA